MEKHNSFKALRRGVALPPGVALRSGSRHLDFVSGFIVEVGWSPLHLNFVSGVIVFIRPFVNVICL